jgi:hypothetical protein
LEILKKYASKKEVDCVNLLTARDPNGGLRLLGLDLGPNLHGASDIYGIKSELSIPGDPFLQGDFNIEAFRPQKLLNNRGYDKRVFVDCRRAGPMFSDMPLLTGIMFNALWINEKQDMPILDRAFVAAGKARSLMAGGWDPNRIWAVVPEFYSAWLVSTFRSGLTQGSLYIGVSGGSSGHDPSLFILRPSELRQEEIDRIAAHFEITASIAGGA